MKTNQTTLIAALALATALPGAAHGSSHMDAPLITRDPSANTTDVYAFVNEDAGFESINAAAIESLKVRENMDTGVQTTAGGVGSALAYSLLLRPEPFDVVVIDRRPEKVASHVIYAAAPGAVTLDVKTLPYKKVRRPKWPLDA